MIKKQIIVLSSNSSWYILNFRIHLIIKLLKLNFRVIAVAPFDDYSKELVGMGCEFVPLEINTKSKNIFIETISVLKIYKIYKLIKPDIILHFTPKLNIYGSIAAWLLNLSCINNISGLGIVFGNKGIMHMIVKTLYKFSQKNAKIVFFQNADDMKAFIKRKIVKKNQAYLLPGSGVDLKLFSQKFTTKNKNFVFLFIARLIIEKGIYEYVQAARIIKKEFPNVNFNVVGFIDVNHPSSITVNDLKTWENENIIKWYGRQDDVRPFICDSDCVVLPSYYREGTPKTLLEAASMGKPLIAADSIGCREPVVDGLNGYLCIPKDPNDLALKMKKMIMMDDAHLLLMGKESRIKMENEYDINIVTNKYIDSIINIIESNTSK